ncbi:hypothetical protein BH11PAT4_BH11PAT4_1100 [soil metagenome]
MLGMTLLGTKAERYRNRKDTIEEWFERDRAKQDRYDNTPEPAGVRCLECDGNMKSTMKHLEDYTNQPLRLLFFFECAKCKKRRGIYENGEEKASKPDPCAKCGGTLNRKSEDKDDVLTITTTCSNCDFTETDVDDFKAWRKEREQREREDEELLEKYRGEYCFSEKEGKEHVELVEAMKFGNEVFEYEKRLYDDPDREAVSQIRRLTAAELEKTLIKPLEDARFEKLMLDRPEITQHVIIPFTVQDADPSRKSDESTRALQSVIKKLLDDTNWRLMDHPSYKMGYVWGRLKGYDQEEDLLKLTRKNDPPKPKELDPEKLGRLGHHNVVQLAKLFGQMEGVENRRKKRLEKEPKGFFLEDGTGGNYTCSICGRSTPGSRMWWNGDGQRCADCWSNIKEGVIPSDLSHKNDKTWFQDSSISWTFDIHSATARKLQRQGILLGRELKLPEEKVYATIFLDKENLEFLENHPKR